MRDSRDENENPPSERGRRLKILNLLLSITETSGAYHQHCVAVSEKRDVTICVYFRPSIRPPGSIALFEGDDTVAGFFRALKAALRAKEYDVVHAHSPHVGFLFVVASLLGIGKHLPISVYNVQNSYQNYKLRNKLLMLPVFPFFKRVVCCSQACHESFPRLYKWLGGRRLRVIANGLDIDRVDRVLGNGARRGVDGGFTVVSLGRLIEIKNPFCVLGAFQQAAKPGSRLVYIGEGNLRERLEAEIRSRGLGEQVTLTGLVPRDEVFEHLGRADLIVSASRGEGLPVAMIEAMACRCPVILSDIEPHREIAQGTDFIPLVHPDDVAGFAREIARFEGMPAARRAEIGEKCRSLVEARYGLATMHAAYEAVFAELPRPAR